ncbi:MAG: ribosome maturation factor RimM [Betaproteobacteria bacterium]
MGRVAAPFGIKGWIKVQTFTETIDGLLGYEMWWLGSGDSWEKYRIEDGVVHGKVILAKLLGAETREVVAMLKGLEVAVPREALPEAEGMVYWTDLVGLRVVNREGIYLGTVDSLLDNGAHGVMVVHGDRERLIPFVPVHVDGVELETGRILVDWQQDF